MQSNHNEIYKLTSERTGVAENIYKDLGNFVFKSLNTNLRKPKSLIIKLKGIGSWYLRKNRMEIVVELFPPDFENAPTEESLHYKIEKFENKVELFNLFKERLKDYDRYIEKRIKVRNEREHPTETSEDNI